MAFYDLTKEERAELVDSIKSTIYNELKASEFDKTLDYLADDDTYIRKAAYQSIGRIYFENQELESKIIQWLDSLLEWDDYRIRQTAINAAGEIGKEDFEEVQHIFDTSLFDSHHSPRNAVIGSIKKMSEANPEPVLNWAKEYLHHGDKEIRREICHGIELRGRKHPQDILPLLRQLQHDETARVRDTLVHVLGQIAYKKGCLETVVEQLKEWENDELVADALDEIIDVHDRYSDFAAMSQAEAQKYIDDHYY